MAWLHHTCVNYWFHEICLVNFGLPPPAILKYLDHEQRRMATEPFLWLHHSCGTTYHLRLEMHLHCLLLNLNWRLIFFVNFKDYYFVISAVTSWLYIFNVCFVHAFAYVCVLIYIALFCIMNVLSEFKLYYICFSMYSLSLSFSLQRLLTHFMCALGHHCELMRYIRINLFIYLFKYRLPLSRLTV